MKAPDYEEIYDLENAVEPAAKAVMAQFGIKAFCQFETDDLPDERVDIQLQAGSATGHRGIINSVTKQFARDAWNCSLVVTIWTKRFEQTGDGQPVKADRRKHGRLRAKVRRACEYFTAAFTPELMPYHELTSIEPAGSDPQVNIEDDLDASTMTFNVLLAVRTGAWPEYDGAIE